MFKQKTQFQTDTHRIEQLNKELKAHTRWMQSMNREREKRQKKAVELGREILLICQKYGATDNQELAADIKSIAEMDVNPIDQGRA